MPRQSNQRTIRGRPNSKHRRTDNAERSSENGCLYIKAASESTEIDFTDIGAIDEIAKKFLKSLTPKEIGFLMHDDPQPLSLHEIDSDIKEKYRAKYGTKNLKLGQFFRLESGTITFFTHEHNLKFKVGN